MTFTESLGIADATNREMWETIYRAPFDGSIATAERRMPAVA